jgi:hypothetical protein
MNISPSFFKNLQSHESLLGSNRDNKSTQLVHLKDKRVTDSFSTSIARIEPSRVNIQANFVITYNP